MAETESKQEIVCKGNRGYWSIGGHLFVGDEFFCECGATSRSISTGNGTSVPPAPAARENEP